MLWCSGVCNNLLFQSCNEYTKVEIGASIFNSRSYNLWRNNCSSFIDTAGLSSNIMISQSESGLALPFALEPYSMTIAELSVSLTACLICFLIILSLAKIIRQCSMPFFIKLRYSANIPASLSGIKVNFGRRPTDLLRCELAHASFCAANPPDWKTPVTFANRRLAAAAT